MYPVHCQSLAFGHSLQIFIILAKVLLNEIWDKFSVYKHRPIFRKDDEHNNVVGCNDFCSFSAIHLTNMGWYSPVMKLSQRVNIDTRIYMPIYMSDVISYWQ